ncbi:hypothetical protein Ancab_034432 [Ancistrocladus abbreviatus]
MSFSRPLPPPSSKPLDVDITIISAKHLKNVNWRNGELKPYAIFWVDPDRRLATKSDDSGNIRPVWNERFLLPVTAPLHDASLSIEIFHFKPSDTPKPLVGTLRLPLREFSASDADDSDKIRTFELRRPSGRPHGKIRLKLAIKERPLPPPPAVPDYHSALPSSYYYSTAPPAGHPVPPPPHARDHRGYAPSSYASSLAALSPSQSPPPYSYSDPYLGYYSGYYAPPPPPALPRPFFDRPLNYGVGSSSSPSAPVDYSSYDQKPKGSKMGAAAAGLGVGLVAGALGGLALEEGLKYEEDKIAERVESDLASRDDYSEYRVDY